MMPLQSSTRNSVGSQGHWGHGPCQMDTQTDIRSPELRGAYRQSQAYGWHRITANRWDMCKVRERERESHTRGVLTLLILLPAAHCEVQSSCCFYWIKTFCSVKGTVQHRKCTSFAFLPRVRLEDWYQSFFKNSASINSVSSCSMGCQV